MTNSQKDIVLFILVLFLAVAIGILIGSYLKMEKELFNFGRQEGAIEKHLEECKE